MSKCIFVIGTFRCGTTSLRALLRQIPDVYVPHAEELWVFYQPHLRRALFECGASFIQPSAIADEDTIAAECKKCMHKPAVFFSPVTIADPSAASTALRICQQNKIQPAFIVMYRELNKAMTSLVVHLSARYALNRIFVDFEQLLSTNNILWEGFCDLFRLSNLQYWAEAFGREHLLVVHTSALNAAEKVRRLLEWMEVPLPATIPYGIQVNVNPYYPRTCLQQAMVYLLMGRLAGKKGLFWRVAGKSLAVALRLSGTHQRTIRNPQLRAKIQEFAQQEEKRFQQILHRYQILVIQ